MKRNNATSWGITLVICSILLPLITGCDYDAPITAEPTRKIEPALLGEWTSTERTDKDCKDQMRLRGYDDSTYVISYNGSLYRAWHSDVDGTALVSVQDLESKDRKYVYFVWSLSADGKRLTLRSVKLDKAMTRDSATVVKVLRSKSQEPGLFEDAVVFTKRNQG